MEILKLERARLDAIEPLWSLLLDHHRAAEPDMAVRSSEKSWSFRRAAYSDWLTEGGFGVIAEHDEEVIGYAIVSIGGPDETWDLGPCTAELQTLVVHPAWRGSGLGASLVEAVDTELERRGIADLLVGVVAGNVGAVRFYERLGWRRRYVVFHRRRADDKTITAMTQAGAR